MKMRKKKCNEFNFQNNITWSLGWHFPSNLEVFSHIIQKESNSVKLIIVYSHKCYTYIPSSSGSGNLYF